MQDILNLHTWIMKIIRLIHMIILMKPNMLLHRIHEIFIGYKFLAYYHLLQI